MGEIMIHITLPSNVLLSDVAYQNSERTPVLSGSDYRHHSSYARHYQESQTDIIKMHPDLCGRSRTGIPCKLL